MSDQPVVAMDAGARRTALWLVVAALVPFFLGVAAAYSGTVPPARALIVLLAYTATIVSFIGGLQWGRILTAGDPRLVLGLVLGVAPALLAWPALLLPLEWCCALLFVALLLAWLADERGLRVGWQNRAFLWQRRVATAAVTSALAAVVMAMIALPV